VYRQVFLRTISHSHDSAQDRWSGGFFQPKGLVDQEGMLQKQ
jgi:hypothetical protein